MPAYNKSAFPAPFKTVQRMGNNPWPVYLYGSFNTKTQPWLFNVATVAVTSNVAYISGTLIGGGGPSPNNVPLAGSVMGVQGTQTNSGIFNVDPTTASTVSFTASTGVCTVTFPLTNANVSSTVDVGTFVIQPPEIPDSLVAGASCCVAITSTPDESDNSRCLFAECTFPSLPTSATVVLQVANVDQDSRYVTVENSAGNTNLATVSGGAITQSGAQYQYIMGKFVRMKVTAVSGGTNPTIVGTVTA